MKLPTIIGISGRKFHGKDTLADYLSSKYGYIKISLADPLKKMVGNLFDFSDDQLYGDQKEILDPRWDITPRQVLQFFGTELIRENIGRLLPHIGDSFWAICLMRNIKKKLSIDPYSKFVISDIRFPNEVDAIRESKIDSKIIRVQRDSILIDKFRDHSSETLVDSLEVDATISNNSDKDLFFTKMDIYLKSIQEVPSQ